MSSSQVIASPSPLPSSSHTHPPQTSYSTGGYQYDPYDNPRTPRRTPMACQFCRGRKLKCDGLKPQCSNCNRRNIPCNYVAV
ncbi:hypothetical protein DFH08DRAFT_692808 [Mycena albidolilacea]|uniref:Zn(2)-C6 fungal-type domain-containing protein n=1 Tax=Mycena albidolilacea TaxID=1033008 RepID=A0AAD7EW10_9AGAR|nr:hypothetical protein DFH08DRAFT_692808 [Mycena albidolilacea]